MAILTEVRDPRVRDVTVTRVEMAPDMRSATVHVSIMGGPAKEKLALQGLARRRPRFAALAEGLDLHAVRGALRPGAVGGAAATAALRSVLTGDTVTEAQAAKWTGRTPACPSCSTLPPL